jgi:hypothetical protein
MSSFNYLFPAISDPDSIDNPIITIKNLTGLLPTFMNKSSTNLTIFPQACSEVKIHEMLAIINDSYNSVEYKFNIIVTNQPPIVNSSI